MDPYELACAVMDSFLEGWDMGTILQSSKQILAGKWNLSFAFIKPVTSIPSTTLQLVDLAASITVSVAVSHPKTITASYFFKAFMSFLR